MQNAAPRVAPETPPGILYHAAHLVEKTKDLSRHPYHHRQSRQELPWLL